MKAASSPRALRIGGVTVSPGEARAVSLALPDREGDAAERDAVPVWVVVGRRAGPRVCLLGAPRGFETRAARLLTALGKTTLPAMTGSLVVVPVLRPGGRFAAAGRPVSPSALWRFPGDAVGRRLEREAFTVFSNVILGSSLILTLSEPEPGRHSTLAIKCDLEDPRARRLARRAGVPAVLHVARRPGSLAAASAPGVIVLELVVAAAESDPDGTATLAAVAALLRAAGAGSVAASRSRGTQAALTPSPAFRRAQAIHAPSGGLIEETVRAGDRIARGAALARIVPPLGESVVLAAPHAALVLEAPARDGVRRGAKLFLLGRLPRSESRRARTGPSNGVSAPAAARVHAPASPPRSSPPTATEPTPVPLHVGWVERVALPQLGVRLRAKIDTGARTSALHVTRMKVVGTTSAPHRRPILEVTIPGGAPRADPAAVVRVPVREYVLIKATSGRSERRPVIETILRMGALERRIRVTLTDRGDMRFPMLIGRTALGPGVLVDPSRRQLLSDKLTDAAHVRS